MNGPIKTRHGTPMAGFILSLIAGLWMLVMGAIVGAHWAGTSTSAAMREGGTTAHAAVVHLPWLSFVLGIIVVISAWLLYGRPLQHVIWGIIILIASIICLISGGVGVLAAILGIIGAIFTLAWRPAAV